MARAECMLWKFSWIKLIPNVLLQFQQYVFFEFFMVNSSPFEGSIRFKFLLQDVPYLFNLKWSSNSRLKDVVRQFKKVFVAFFEIAYKILHQIFSIVDFFSWVWTFSKAISDWFLNPASGEPSGFLVYFG